MLSSILAATTGSITLTEILLCTMASLVLGAAIAGVYMFRNSYSRSFVVTLALLPAMVQSVILVVNGNLGTGVAVMGAFSLVRFRSVPGSAREIGSIFFSMAIGLATGMGYIAYATLFTVIISAIMLVYAVYAAGGGHTAQRSLRITVPEDVDYSTLFDDIFKTYTRQVRFEKVKTTNLGSLFELQYSITLRDTRLEKQFIDEIRKRNSNLNIVCASKALMREDAL